MVAEMSGSSFDASSIHADTDSSCVCARASCCCALPRGVDRAPPLVGRDHRPLTKRYPVTIAAGKHLFPSRTQQLSPPAPMVLPWQRGGRVGHRRVSLFSSLRIVRLPVRGTFRRPLTADHFSV